MAELKRESEPGIVLGQEIGKAPSAAWRKCLIIAAVVVFLALGAAVLLAWIRYELGLSFANYMLFLVLPLQALPIGLAVRRLITLSRFSRGVLGGFCSLAASLLARIFYLSFATATETSLTYKEVLSLMSQNPDMLITAFIVPIYAVVIPEAMAFQTGYEFAAGSKKTTEPAANEF